MTSRPLLLLRRWACLILLALVINTIQLSESVARMGGGHSYSSGQSESSGGSSGGASRPSNGGWSGGGHWSGYSSSRQPGYGTYVPPYGQPVDDADPVTSIIEIVFLILLIYVLFRLLGQGSVTGDTHLIKSRTSEDPHDAEAGFKPIPGIIPVQREFPGGLSPAMANLDEKLLGLKSRDQNFSRVLFLDFACLLFHKFYTFRGSDQFRLITPFLSKDISDNTNSDISLIHQRIHEIVIGNASIKNVLASDKMDNILVEFECNFTLTDTKNDRETRLATKECWTFARQKGVLSPQPSQMRNLSCPSCGAPADFTDYGECQYCHAYVRAGENQWQVVKIDSINSQPTATEAPGGYQQESGTERPTLIQAGLQIRLETFMKKHGLINWGTCFNEFCKRVVKPYFLATYAAWSTANWQRARHLVSDRLYESNGFWMKEYERQGWRNILENIDIRDIEIASIDLDKFYESVTVRVFASCLDYTIDKQGKLLGGSRYSPRRFSEYWTFIRTTGTERIDNEFDLNTCPACGAPADKVGQAGICGYCGSKLSEGQFSWVLTAITQDEVYTA